HGVVALVVVEAEGPVGLVGVEAGVLEHAGVALGVDPDPAALLAKINQVAALLRDALHRLAELGPAVAPGAAEHVAGQALAVQPHRGWVRAVLQPAGGGSRPETEREVLPAVEQAVEGERPCGG